MCCTVSCALMTVKLLNATLMHMRVRTHRRQNIRCVIKKYQDWFLDIFWQTYKFHIRNDYCSVRQWLRETWVQSQVERIPKTLKMVLDASLLNIQHYKVRSRVKWRSPGKGVAPSPTPWSSSYRKGSLRVTLDYGRRLYFTTLLYLKTYQLSWNI